MKLKSLALILMTAFALSSCVDKEYDDIQTANVDPNITPTHTIRQLQAYATGPVGVEITEDIIIAGVVVADDSSGNIYKKLILQQDSSGIAVNIDKSDYYTEYRVGRRIFVKCKGLFISNDGGNVELGNSASDPVGRIPWGLVGQYLVKGMWGQHLAPRVYNIGDNIPTNTLVQFNNVEFVNQNVVWAADGYQNLDVQECGANPNTLVIYSSTFSTFALKPVPNGNGSIVGIYTIFNSEGELQVRDERDANMNNLRCNGYIQSLLNMPLDSICMNDPGTGIYSLDTARKITVTVTSDYTTEMVTYRNAYAQDSTAGIQLRFTDGHTFSRGTVLMIDISNLELSNFNGQLQINNIPLQRAIPVGSASVTPLTTTIPNINLNYIELESQLIKLDNVTIHGTGTFQGTNGQNWIVDAATLQDSIMLYTASFATFVNDPYPTGTVSVTGILTEYNGVKEILIRNTNDIQ